MADIFLSYAREDRDAAERLVRAFEAAGWSVWWDPRIATGQPFRDAIASALRDARCVVVLWSHHSVSSRYVNDEAEDAASRNVLVPVLIGRVVPPIGLRGIQRADLVGWKGDDDAPAFRRLKNDVRRLAPPSMERAPAAHPPRRRRLRSTVLVAAIIMLLMLTGAAVALGPRATAVRSSLTATRALLHYQPDRIEQSRRDSPFLDQVHATLLVVSSFASIEIPNGQLFRESPPGIRQPVAGSLPIRITGADPTASASFGDIWIHRLKSPARAAILASAIERNGRAGMRFVVDGGPSEITVVRPATDRLTITCQSCAVATAHHPEDRQRRNQQSLIVAIAPTARTTIRGGPGHVGLDLVPADGAFREQFPVTAGRFCAGSAGDPPPLLGGSLTFPDAAFADDSFTADDAPGERRTLTLTAADALVVKGFRLLPRDGARPPAFTLDISGQAQDVRQGITCDEGGRSIVPSHLSHLLRAMRFSGVR